jgi:protein N-terminal methyltransferase
LCCVADISSSKEFLKTLEHGTGCALDCGAGIGRISKELLLPIFKTVDLVEQNPLYVAKAKELIPDKRLENFYTVGLQNFTYAHALPPYFARPHLVCRRSQLSCVM